VHFIHPSSSAPQDAALSPGLAMKALKFLDLVNIHGGRSFKTTTKKKRMKEKKTSYLLLEDFF
jgi:hypothetical protein